MSAEPAVVDRLEFEELTDWLERGGFDQVAEREGGIALTISVKGAAATRQ